MHENGQRRTIVSVTPLALERDSRTLKQALSLAAAGYRSVVVAAGRMIEISAGAPIPAGGAVAGPLSAPSVTERRMEGLRRKELPWLVQAQLFGGWLALFGMRYVVRPLWRMPRGSLFILHECSSFPAVRLRAALSGAPIIYDVHDHYTRIEPDESLPALDRRFLVPFVRLLERRAFAAASATMTISDGLAGELSAIHDCRPVVVRNVHDARLDQASRPGLRQRLELPDGVFVLVTVGNAKRGQALKQGLDALTALPERVHWVVVGDGYERIVPLIAARGLERRVHLLGRLAPDDIVPALGGGDAALVLYHDYSSNYRYALPNGFFQAIAAGLPQIVPPLPEVAALTRRYGFGVEADPRDPASIAAAVRALLDSDLRDELRARATGAAPELSWEVEESRFLALVRSLAGPP